MRLLDLVEQHHRVRVAAHGLGELAALLMSHVARGRTDELGDLVLAAELGHVKADERIFAAEQVLGERLGELGLAGARGAQKDEGTARATGVLERAAAAPDRLRDGGDRLVLPDDTRLERALAGEQATTLVLRERRDGHARGHRDDVGDLGHIDDDRARVELGIPGGAGLAQGDFGGLLLFLGLGGAVHVVRGARLLDGGLELDHAGLGLAHGLGRLVARDASAGTGLVDEVDRLVGQEAVLDVAGRKTRRRLKGRLRVTDVVVLLIFGSELGKDRHGVGRARLIHVDSLEAALERRILCQVLTELLGGGGTDDLEGAACEDRLEHGARVD